MESQFEENPFDWDEHTICKFMQACNADKKFIDSQAILRYKGSDFLMYDEDHIFRFFKANTQEEKDQLRNIRNQIHVKSQNFNSQNLDDSDNVVISQPLKVTGQPQNSDSNVIAGSKQLYNSDATQIPLTISGMMRINDLPYDPFDFDTVMNYEAAKNDYENYLQKCPLFRQYQEFKSKRSYQRKIETQLVLEIKRNASQPIQNEPGQQTVDKFAIKENQTVILGQSNCDLPLRDKAVSRKHVLIENINGVCSIQDQGSSCGTFIRIKNQQIPLKEGSIFECGFQEFQVTKIIAKNDSAHVKLTIYDGNEMYKGKEFDLNIQNRFLIGRNKLCDFGSLFQEDLDLSSYHAKLSIKDNVLSIMDLDSVKGTWLRLSPHKTVSAKFQIQNDSEIKINPFMITVKVNQIGDTYVNQSPISNNGMCISCKIVKANMQVFPCQHVVACKQCFQKLNLKQCPRSDCNTPIKSVEILYNC